MVERYQFHYRRDYSQWPQWLKEAWAKKSSLPGAFYPAWGAEDLRFFVATPTGPQEVNDGDVLVYSPATGEIQVEPAPTSPLPHRDPAAVEVKVLSRGPQLHSGPAITGTGANVPTSGPRVIVGSGGDIVRM
jgi:hypothetical protein